MKSKWMFGREFWGDGISTHGVRGQQVPQPGVFIKSTYPRPVDPYQII